MSDHMNNTTMAATFVATVTTSVGQSPYSVSNVSTTSANNMDHDSGLSQPQPCKWLKVNDSIDSILFFCKLLPEELAFTNVDNNGVKGAEKSNSSLSVAPTQQSHQKLSHLLQAKTKSNISSQQNSGQPQHRMMTWTPQPRPQFRYATQQFGQQMQPQTPAQQRQAASTISQQPQFGYNMPQSQAQQTTQPNNPHSQSISTTATPPPLRQQSFPMTQQAIEGKGSQMEQNVNIKAESLDEFVSMPTPVVNKSTILLVSCVKHEPLETNEPSGAPVSSVNLMDVKKESDDSLTNKEPKKESVATPVVPTETNDIKPEEKPSPVCQKKVFKLDELRQALMPTLDKLYRQNPESLPFIHPVDPMLLQIPDYFDIIKRPMDLSTIKNKLDSGQYADPWQYVDDMWLMFDNAWLYNQNTSRVYRYCTKLSEVFVAEIDPVMQSLGYCCGRKYEPHFQILCCFGKEMCTIPRDANYMNYQNKYAFCMKCFSDIPFEDVIIGDAFGVDPILTRPHIITKDMFFECKNDSSIYCKDCGRKFHQFCVMHHDPIWHEGFTCDACLRREGRRRKENKYNSKSESNLVLIFRQQELKQRIEEAQILKKLIAQQSSQPQQRPQHEFSPSSQQSTSQQEYLRPRSQPLALPWFCKILTETKK